MLTFFSKKVFLRDLLPGFVDIHCHLLPGIDDGAKDTEQAIQLITGLKDLGVQGFRATPHIMEGVYLNNSETITQARDRLLPSLQNAGMGDIYIGFAAEYMLDHGFEQELSNGSLLCLKDKYILVEMSYYRPPERMDQLLFATMNAGYRPILAHPERYNFANSIEDFQKFRTLGCVFQLNLLSLGRQYGPHVRKKALMLLKKGWYEFAGTDTHHHKHIEKLGGLEIPKPVSAEVDRLLRANSLFLD